MSEKQQRYRSSEKGSARHREYMREYMIEWRRKRKESEEYDPDRERKKWREQHARTRERAMEKLGGLRCSECGCDQPSILEINHIHGGGRQHLKTTQSRSLYRSIVNDTVNSTDYNVLCRVCNALHYVRDILGIEGHEIKWRGSLIG